MSDDEADPELLALLRQSLGLGEPAPPPTPKTGVLEGAEYVYDNAVDVAIDSSSTKAAARLIWHLMQQEKYSTSNWSAHELHPKTKDEATVNFIFTMDLLNFSFWSELPAEERFCVEYRGKRWTGYWSLVACLQRALDEDIPITTSDFWQDENECTDDLLAHVFRSATSEPMPLLAERIACLREAGRVLYESFSCRPANITAQASHSAANLVNLLTTHFPFFNDSVPSPYPPEPYTRPITIPFHKRAQILVADLWAAFAGSGPFGTFHDIDSALTIFPDYRIPQMLHTLGCLRYSPKLEAHIRAHKAITSGERWEVEIRGCSVWCGELLRREIERVAAREGVGTERKVNAVLMDFWLYDSVKEREEGPVKEVEVEPRAGSRLGVVKEEDVTLIPHHRTRSIWY
ncbi:MAG: hypothetical protein Q9227_006085 [Pyrenula ochraceoflavens]